MRPTDQALLQRLRERIAEVASARPRQAGLTPRPPISGVALAAAEQAIGFRLPELVRALYLDVGNGGFGPAHGLVGVLERPNADGDTLQTCYARLLGLQTENSVWRWPTRLLPLADYGCGMWSCVDCETTDLAMILWDPNNLDANLRRDEARLNWGNAFWDQGGSLRSWLERWLAGEPDPEPKWPSDAWMRSRLGFTLPG
jgi:hypothetical protein